MGVSGERVVRSRTGQAEVIQLGGGGWIRQETIKPKKKKCLSETRKTGFLFGLRAFPAAFTAAYQKIYIYIY